MRHYTCRPQRQTYLYVEFAGHSRRHCFSHSPQTDIKPSEDRARLPTGRGNWKRSRTQSSHPMQCICTCTYMHMCGCTYPVTLGVFSCTTTTTTNWVGLTMSVSFVTSVHISTSAWIWKPVTWCSDSNVAQQQLLLVLMQRQATYEGVTLQAWNVTSKVPNYVPDLHGYLSRWGQYQNLQGITIHRIYIDLQEIIIV